MKRRFLALSTVIGMLFSVVVAAPGGAAITAAPSNVVGVYDGADIAVTWDAATSDNGPITYSVDLLDGVPAVVDTDSPAGLTTTFVGVGVGPFTVRVTATDADPASSETTSAVIPTRPGAPTIGVATAESSTTASVVFTGVSAANDGGSEVTGYTVTSSPGGLTGTSTTSPIAVAGLSSETAYTFTVVAENVVGSSDPSVASNEITTPEDPTGPGAPTIGTASLVDDDSADVAFTAPADDGGSPITGYTVTVSPGGATVLGAASPIRVDGLAASTTYSFTVTATNAIDTGPASDSSNDITTPDPAQVPDAPTIGSAILSDLDSASVAFSAPGDDGGSAITSYTVTSSPGSLTGTGGTSPVLVDGLQPGTEYTFTVTATNDVGTGAASGASNSVTTVDFPGAPTGVSAILVDKTSGRVSFTAPADDGGSALGDYTVTAVPDDGSLATITQTGSADPIDLSGLSAGATYTVTVQASNVLGAGPASTSVELVVPSVPDLPVNVVASSETPFSSTITVSWGAPEDSGGAPVLSYEVTLAGQTVSVDASVTENKFTAVPVGTHVAEVHAVTVAGDGPVATAQEIEVRGFPPFNSEAGLIRQLYVDFLGREADSGGLAYWSGQTANDGSNIASIARRFMFSEEFAPRRAITRLYLAFFNRRPDVGGMDFWADRINSGQANLDTISDSFVGSNEFQTTYGSLSDRDFIRLVYNNVLVRQPDQAGFDYWQAQMTGGLTRGQVMTQFSESPEFVNGTRPAVDVIVTYRGMLNRQPEDSGFSFWLGEIAGNSDAIEGLIQGFYNSAEYAERITP